MNKNYYEILQIDKNASPEVIEKVYKTLAKKYHPDLQKENKKAESEIILKQINEAYEVLSDSEKRRNYDDSLINSYITKEEYNQLYTENQMLKNKLHKMQETLQNAKFENPPIFNEQQQNNNQYNNYQYNNNSSHNHSQNNFNNSYYEDELQQARSQAYYDAYIQDLKNRGYKIKYQKTFKDYINSIVSILLTLFILFLIYQIPFVKNFFKDNILVQTCVNLFNTIISKN